MKTSSRVSITLHSKAAEIIQEIPKYYRSSLISGIISRAIEEGVFFEELSKYLTANEIKEIEELYKNKGIIFPMKYSSFKKENKRYIDKIPSKIIRNSLNKENIKTNNELNNKKESLFIGFDD